MTETSTALAHQVGGQHYKGFSIQPVEFSLVNNLNTAQANIVKYILRDKEGSADDLGKAVHYAELWLDIVGRYRLPHYGRPLATRQELGLPVIELAHFIDSNELSDGVAEILRLIIEAPDAGRVREAIWLMGEMGCSA